MTERWLKIAAADYCSSVRDGTHDSPKQASFGKKLITSRHIIGGRIDLDKAYLISDSDFAEINRRSKVDQWDVLITMIGTVGEPCLVTSEPDFAIKNIGLFKSKSELHGKWLYYYLKTPATQELIRSGTSGTTQTYIALGTLRSLPIIYPRTRDEMAAIVNCLGALDDKIELNRRMNETLEAMARALFRDWFVDFGPTRAKMAGTAPYLSPDLWALFPDRLDDEGKPEGWEVFKLEQIVEHHTKTLTPTKMADAEVEHFSLPAFDKGQTPAIDHGTTIKSNKTLVPPEAILLSKLNPEIPRIWMPETQSRLQQVSSTEFLAYTAKGGAGRSLLFCLFSDRGFREMLHGMVTGTSKSHQRISPPSLLGRDVITGTPEMFGSFEQLVAPFLERVRSNRAESRTLAHTRDLLLPRLMSGELRIAPAECIAEEVL